MIILMVVIALIFNKWLIPILVGFAALDTILYFSLGDIVICYSCKAIYRGLPISSQTQGFDLKIHDRYEFKKKK